MSFLYYEIYLCINMHENTIITNMTQVTAGIILLEGFTLFVDCPSWNPGEADGSEGPVLMQFQASWL